MVVLIIIAVIIGLYALTNAMMEDYIKESNTPLYEKWKHFDNSWKGLIFSNFQRDEEEDGREIPVSRPIQREESSSEAAPAAERETERTAPKQPRISSTAQWQKPGYPQLFNSNDAIPMITPHQIHIMKNLDNWEGHLRVRFKGRTRRERLGLDLQDLAGSKELLTAASTIETSIQKVLDAGLNLNGFEYYKDLYERGAMASRFCAEKAKALKPLYVMADDLYKRINDPNDAFWFTEKGDNQILSDVYNLVHETMRLLEAHSSVLTQLNLTLCDRAGNDLDRVGRAWATEMLHELRTPEHGQDSHIKTA